MFDCIFFSLLVFFLFPFCVCEFNGMLKCLENHWNRVAVAVAITIQYTQTSVCHFCMMHLYTALLFNMTIVIIMYYYYWSSFWIYVQNAVQCAFHRYHLTSINKNLFVIALQSVCTSSFFRAQFLFIDFQSFHSFQFLLPISRYIHLIELGLVRSYVFVWTPHCGGVGNLYFDILNSQRPYESAQKS